MLIHFSEQTIDGFLLPSFTLSPGELLLIKHPNDPSFGAIRSRIIDLLTGKVQQPSVEIYTSLQYVAPIRPERSFWHRLFPLTVSAYHNKHANKANPVYQMIYKNEWIKPQTDIRTIPGNPRQLISLYTTLSWTNNIIFDFAGMDPMGCQEVYNIVKEETRKGCAAIFFDFCDEFSNDCTKVITVTK